MPDSLSTNYINSSDYETLKPKLTELQSVLDDLVSRIDASRKLRYAEVDIEAERESGRLLPDELYVPQHIIDTNIRREQSPYVQYITQSPRAVICQDNDDPTIDLQPLDTDLTKKLRYDGWQLPQFSNIDGFQANGYGVMEIIMDQSKPGGVGHEYVQYCDFAFKSDTRDIQAVEMTQRTYYFTRTRLVELCGDGSKPEHWNRTEVDKVIGTQPVSNQIESSDAKDTSLYKVYKTMFRVNGIVNVAWCYPQKCSNWLRGARPLYLGRRKVVQPTPAANGFGGMLNRMNPFNRPQAIPAQTTQSQVTQSEEVYETQLPYIIFPYLISENDTLAHLKGRVFLDQDLQEAVSSLVSSTVTQARRASGLYFSKETSDPNDDILETKNIFIRSGCLINSKVTQFQLDAPDPSMFSAIQMLVSNNQNETSQVNFAVNNRKDSRKTAKEVSTAENQQQQLSTVQVVLYAIALTQMYRLMVDIIKSRVLVGLIKVNPAVLPLYQRNFSVKPSGDTDVIEKQQLIQKMMTSWPVVEKTAAATPFLADLLELLFPDRAAKYVKAIQDALAQQQSQQAQQQQMMMNFAMQMARGIQTLAKHKNFFSEEGKIHALPQVEMAADQIDNMEQQMKQPQGQTAQ